MAVTDIPPRAIAPPTSQARPRRRGEPAGGLGVDAPGSSRETKVDGVAAGGLAPQLAQRGSPVSLAPQSQQYFTKVPPPRHPRFVPGVTLSPMIACRVSGWLAAGGTTGVPPLRPSGVPDEGHPVLHPWAEHSFSAGLAGSLDMTWLSRWTSPPTWVSVDMPSQEEA